MQARILGPLRLWDGSAWSAVGGAQPRLVLAVLLIEAGRVVTTDRLIDEIWGARPPPTAVNTVHGYVHRLRRMRGSGLGDGLVTRGRGYELMVDPDELDANVFERLVADGRRDLADGRMEVAVSRLSEGLLLWHGSALADVPAGPTVVAEATRLEQHRLTALEARLGAELDLGRPGDVVDELLGLVREHPLREGLRALLMLALYRCGRRAEALDAYREGRRVCVAELGLEPGAELRELEQAILTDEPRVRTPTRPAPIAPRATPEQLPADLATFTGRIDDLRTLDTLLAGVGDTAPSPVVSSVTGMAGVGKTALAVHWAHRVRERFPDGQLYVDLRGHGAGPPVRPIEVLASFLRALGVAAPDVPVDLPEAAALYRSLLAHRRVLVLLDNADDPEQVRPLLPAGSGCLVLVTSRDRLVGLVALDGAIQLTVDVLTGTEARTLLARLIGADRVAAEPAASDELAGLCGGLPLALRIAAANVTTHAGRTIEDYVGQLRDRRLAALQVEGDRHAAVQTAFDHSYTALPDDARRLFRRIGTVPGPDIGCLAAAALVGDDPAEAQRRLDRLGNANLVDERTPGRYALHDLLRKYAAERAAAEDHPSDRDATRDRLLDFYRRRVDAAAERLYPHLLRLPTIPGPRPGPTFDDDAQASAWLDAERPNLIAIVGQAAREGPHAVAWRLADALRGYLYLRMYTVDWLAVAQAGLAAAELDGDRAALAAAHLSLGMLHWVQGRHERSTDHNRKALALARRAGWVAGQSTALSNLGNVCLNLGQFTEAAEHYARALAIDRRADRSAGLAVNLTNLGVAFYGLGRLELAAHHHTQALTAVRRTGSRSGEARILGNLGEAYRRLGRLDDALAVLTSALAVHREIGDRNIEGDTLRALAAVHRDAGRHREALRLARAAVSLAAEIGDTRLSAAALVEQASVHDQLGDHALAADAYGRARAVAHDTGNRYAEAESLIGLAAAERHAGHLVEAAGYARRGLALARHGGYLVHEGAALTVLAAIERDRGRPGPARARAHRALTIQSRTGDHIGQVDANAIMVGLGNRPR